MRAEPARSRRSWKTRPRALLAGAALAATLSAAGQAGADERAPEFDPGKPEGAELTAHMERAFDRYDLPIGPFGTGAAATRAVEGRVVWSAYKLADPAATTAGVLAAYHARLTALGFSEVFSCSTDDCGGFEYRFSVKLLPAPGMLLDVADFSQLTMEHPATEGMSGRVSVSIVVSRVLEAIYVQTVLVLPAETPVEIVDSETRETPAETVIIPQEEKALFDRLMADGHVSLSGLFFESGGAALSPESAEALDRIARLLNRNADVVVALVGHSDNQGELEPNIKLSQARAEAVRQALIARNVPKDQVIARGVGWLAPVASNATEEGRAKNRRVELVLVRAP